jgi:very-short-patch-repair endonuclease
MTTKPPLNKLREAIADALAEEKSYNLPKVCEEFGLPPGTNEEAYSSKRVYVKQRLIGKSEEILINLAQRVLKDYSSEELRKILSQFISGNFKISLINRKNILDELIIKSEELTINGKLDLIDFLKRIWSLDTMPPTDKYFKSAAQEITQRMVITHEWNYHYLFNSYLGLTDSSDKILFRFMEQLTHPLVQEPEIQKFLVNLINNHLVKDGYRLEAKEEISGLPLYQVIKIGSGVSGNIKNLIFAANGPKPELILEDSINNDIRIVKNGEFCLIYDQPIPSSGLFWKNLVSWWAKKSNIEFPTRETEESLYKRLVSSLVSPPEKLLFYTYYKKLRDTPGESLPALIPQVYLHYDPYTLRELKEKRIPRQRMDFLILFSHQERVVIEVDGKQHYADDDIASPRKYADMVAEDRKLKLAGYEIYRFGGYELEGESGKYLVENFFDELIKKYIKGAKL